MVDTLEEIAERLKLMSEFAKIIDKDLPKDMDPELRDVLLNQRIEQEMDIWDYTHR